MMGNILGELKYFFSGKKMMRKTTVLAWFLFLLAPLFLFSEDDPSQFNANRVFSLIETLAKTTDRSEGSAGEAEAFRLITRSLESWGVDYKVIPFREMETASSRSQIIEASLPGTGESEMILVVPVNNSELNPAGGSIGIALALELIHTARNQPEGPGLRILFMGGEKRTRLEAPPLGSTWYVDVLREEKPSFVIYLDLDYPSDSIVIDTGSRKPGAPLWLVKKVLFALKQGNLLPIIRESDRYLSLTGQSIHVSPLTPWLEDEIPAIRLVSGKGSGLSPEWMARVQIYRLGVFLSTLRETAPDTIPDSWDTNYAMFRLPGDRILILAEQGLVLALYLILIFLCLVILLRERAVRFNIKRETRYLWTGPVFLFLTFLFLFLSTLILELICELRRFPNLWMEAPRVFFTFKIMLTSLMTLVFLHLVGGLPVSRSPHFYTYAAFLASLINLFIFSLIHVSLGIYYLWTILFLLLFQATRSIFLRTLSAVAMPLLTLLVLYQTLSPENPDFARLVLFSRQGGNFLIALGILPYLFIIASLNNLSFHYTGSRRKTGVLVSILSSGILSLFFLFQIFLIINPWENRPQPVEMLRMIDMTSGFQTFILRSPSPMPPLRLEIPGSEPRLLENPGRFRSVGTLLSGPVLTTEKSRLRFLNREKYTLSIQAPGRVRKTNLTLSGDKPLNIYNSNYPYQASPDGKRVVFYTDLNPANPFILELTLLTGDQGELTIEMELDDYENPARLSGNNIDPRITTRIRTVIPVGSELPSP